MTDVTRPITSSTKVEPSARHFGGGNARGLAGFRENGKDPEVEGIVANEERERDAQYAGHDGEIRPHRRQYELNHALGDRIDAPAGRAQYARRFAKMEPVFANLRANTRLDRFTLRGRAKVDTQWKLCCLVHNIETLANNGYAA